MERYFSSSDTQAREGFDMKVVFTAAVLGAAAFSAFAHASSDKDKCSVAELAMAAAAREASAAAYDSEKSKLALAKLQDSSEVLAECRQKADQAGNDSEVSASASVPTPSAKPPPAAAASKVQAVQLKHRPAAHPAHQGSRAKEIVRAPGADFGSMYTWDTANYN